jgi:hypothetical protein
MQSAFSPSAASGVGHPIKPVPDVRSTDARRRERHRPEGVAHSFQVILYKVEPRPDIVARNLLSNDDWRAALADEMMEVRPQVPLVIKPSSFACRAERLARTGTGPNRSVVWPAGAAKGEAPDTDASEEVALAEATQVVWVNVLDASLVDDTCRNVPGGDEVSEPLGGVWVDFIVVGAAHDAAPEEK